MHGCKERLEGSDHKQGLALLIARLLAEPSLATTFQGLYFVFYILPLHVKALVGHHQADTQLF
jgi:hypothetical protein